MTLRRSGSSADLSWTSSLRRGVRRLRGRGIVFGSGAIALHGMHQNALRLVRPPSDIDVYGDPADIVTSLREEGYVRTGPTEFRRASGELEFPIHIWAAERFESPAGVPPCLQVPVVIAVDGQNTNIASLDDLFVMKCLVVRYHDRKRLRDAIDRETIKALMLCGRAATSSGTSACLSR
jgi:hypothetical protein